MNDLSIQVLARRVLAWGSLALVAAGCAAGGGGGGSGSGVVSFGYQRQARTVSLSEHRSFRVEQE